MNAWDVGANASDAQIDQHFVAPIEGDAEHSAEGVAADAPLSGLEVFDETTSTVPPVPVTTMETDEGAALDLRPAGRIGRRADDGCGVDGAGHADTEDPTGPGPGEATGASTRPGIGVGARSSGSTRRSWASGSAG